MAYYAKDCIKDFSNLILSEVSEDELIENDDFTLATKLIILLCKRWTSVDWSREVSATYPELTWVESDNAKEFLTFLFYYFNQLGIVISVNDVVKNLSVSFVELIENSLGFEITPSMLVFDNLKIFNTPQDNALVQDLHIEHITRIAV